MMEIDEGSAPSEYPSAQWVVRLRDVSEAAVAVASELDLDRALQRIVDAARELVRSRYGALGIARSDLAGLSQFIVSGVGAEEIRAVGRWPRGRGLLGVLLRDPRPLRVRRIADDPRSVGFPPNHPRMDSFLGVPIRSGDRIIGNFYLADKMGADEFSQEDEDIAVLFAAHAAVAVENARRFSETSARLSQSLLEIQRAEMRSRFLAELSSLLPIGPIVDQIPWETVTERTADLLGDGCAIYLVDPTTSVDLLTKVVAHHDPVRAAAGGRFIDESWDTIRAEVLLKRRSLFVAVLDAHGLRGSDLDQALMRREKLSAALTVPIQTERRVYGIFAALASQPATFSHDDLTFARLVADRLGIALENAELIRQLRAALQARDEFVSVATHELKTPTTVLRGYVQALLTQGEARSEGERRALAAINKQTGRLTDLINELLDVSRIRVGRLELRRERFDLVALCREVVERFALLTPEGTAARLRLEIGDAGLWGDWDRSRIDQVLTNLVGNALKYSPAGGEVIVRARRSGEAVEVAVTDHGIGIPSAQQANIFEPFGRASNAIAQRIEGAGLGLHITREIVEQHGGQIGFESEDGRGSTFHFTLPTGLEDR